MDAYITNRDQKEMPLLMGVMIFFVFFLYNYTGVQILFYLGLAGMCFCLFALSFQELFLLCMILLPNLTSIKMLGSDTAWYGFFMMLVGVKYLIYKKMVISPWLIAHVACCFITILMYLEYSLLSTIIRNVVFFIFVFSAFKNEKSFQSLKFQKTILIYYLIGLFLNTAFGLFFWWISDKNIFNGFFYGIRNGRNYFASIIAHGVGLGFLFLFNEKDKFFAFRLLFLLLLVFCGALTGSRTFLLSLVFIVLEFIFLIMKPKNTSKGMFIILIALAIMLVFSDVIMPVFRNVIERFSNSDAKGGNGRFALWREYLKLTFSSVERALFGNGLAINYKDVISIEGYPFQVEHNTVVQAIFTTGIFGTVTLFMIYFTMYKVIVPKRKKFDLAVWMPLCAGLLFYMSISSLYSDQFNLLIMISFITINVFTNEKKPSPSPVLPLKNRLYNEQMEDAKEIK